MPSVPVLMSNGWLAGTEVPASCSSGVSPDFYNEATGELFTCAGGTYVNVTGGASQQSPWIANVDAAGFDLVNAGVLHCDSVVTGGAGPDNVQLGGVNLNWQTGTVARWVFQKNGAEGGGNSGSNMLIIPFDDGGTPLPTAVTITRATGNISFAGSIANPGMPTVAPAAGSKILWSDPADGDRVKLAV